MSEQLSGANFNDMLTSYANKMNGQTTFTNAVQNLNDPNNPNSPLNTQNINNPNQQLAPIIGNALGGSATSGGASSGGAGIGSSVAKAGLMSYIEGLI